MKRLILASLYAGFHFSQKHRVSFGLVISHSKKELPGKTNTNKMDFHIAVPTISFFNRKRISFAIPQKLLHYAEVPVPTMSLLEELLYIVVLCKDLQEVFSESVDVFTIQGLVRKKLQGVSPQQVLCINKDKKFHVPKAGSRLPANYERL